MINKNRSTGQHTPGPWEVMPPWSGFSEIRGANGELVFGLAAGGEKERRPEDEIEANASLIEAAPEMLAELKHLYRLLEPALNNGVHIAGLATVNKLALLIAKAEGK